MRETTTVLLSEMAQRINEMPQVMDQVAVHTPYDWWKRHKAGALSISLPTPIRFVGRSPVFLWRDVRRWYLLYKEL